MEVLQQAPPKKQKKTVLVRQRLQDHIKNAQNLPSHPTLSHVKVLNAPNKKKALEKKSGGAMRRMSVSMQKLTESRSGKTGESGKSNDSGLNIPMISALEHIVPINSNDVLNEDDRYVAEIQGPQLKLSRSHVSFVTLTGTVAFDYVIVENNGTASIYHEWKAYEKEKLNTQALDETSQTFYCHHDQNVIKPGESKKFIFAFLSSMTGIFYEEWYLKCEPPTQNPLEKLKLSGHAIKVDNLKEWRGAFDQNLKTTYLQKSMNEIVEDVFKLVKSPTPPLPNLNDPEICKQEFERKNPNLYYNPLVIKWFKNLEREIYSELKLNPSGQYWDMSIEQLKSLILKIKDLEVREFFESKLQGYIELSKKLPVERSVLFDEFKSKIRNIVDNVRVISDQVREDLQMWEYQYLPPPENPCTPEEQKVKDDEFQALKKAWLTKTKKKKWTDEEDKAMVVQYKKLQQEKLESLISQQFGGIEENEPYTKLKAVVNNKKISTQEFFQELLIKKPLKEMDIEGRTVLLRVHLTLGNTEQHLKQQALHEERLIKHKEEEEKRLEEEKIQAEKALKEKKKGKRPPAKKGKDAVQEEKKESVEIDVSFLDQDNLKHVLNVIKFLIERMAKQVFIMASYDKPSGEYKLTKSTQFFFNYLKQFWESNVHSFEPSCIIENFAEKAESDFPDNSIIVLENCYFQPEEIGFKFEGKDKQSLRKYTFEDRKDYIQQINNYADLYVVEDRFNLFKNGLTSMNYIKTENNVFGLQLTDDIQKTAYLMLQQKSPFLAILGGAITVDKLQVLYNLLNTADRVFLMGEFGYLYYCIVNNLNSLGKLPINEKAKEILQMIMKQTQTNDEHKCEVLYPRDFSVSLENNQLPPAEFADYIEQNLKNWAPVQGEHSFPLPDNHVIVDYGTATQELLFQNITNSQKIAWFNTLGVLMPPYPQLTNSFAVKLLSQLNYEKRARQEANKANKQYEYLEDSLVFLFGSDICSIISVLDKPVVQVEIDQAEVQSQGKSNAELEAEEEEKVEEEKSTMSHKKKTYYYYVEDVADMVVYDADFALKILKGEFNRSISSVDNYQQRQEEGYNEGMSFIDDFFSQSNA